jgi:hypothetical protein
MREKRKDYFLLIESFYYMNTLGIFFAMTSIYEKWYAKDGKALTGNI